MSTIVSSGDSEAMMLEGIAISGSWTTPGQRADESVPRTRE
jgi:hypothetical protein